MHGGAPGRRFSRFCEHLILPSASSCSHVTDQLEVAGGGHSGPILVAHRGSPSSRATISFSRFSLMHFNAARG
jgi:hypothetical protein